jgi:N-acetylneuraminic acid mutarotase
MSRSTTPLTVTALLVALAAAPAANAQPAGTWAPTGPLRFSTEFPAAAPLADGRVLIAGGDQGSARLALKLTQIYDPATNAWSKTAPMLVKRTGHAAVPLPDGRVFVAGGYFVSWGVLGPKWHVLRKAETYNPATNTWTAAALMKTARTGHTVTRLADGRVLVAGGMAWMYENIRPYCMALAEIYDPATNVWTSAGSMTAGRCGQTATLLPDGRVLVAGGWSRVATYTTDIYDPVTNTWSATGSMTQARTTHGAALLQDGRVLVAGPDASGEIWDPATGAWTPTTPLAAAHAGSPLVALEDGTVLVCGGAGYLSSAERYDPLTATWSPAAPMSVGRAYFGAVRMLDGRVIVAGGPGGWASAEIYSPW